MNWFTQTRFPVAELRFINSSPEFAKRMITNSTKNLERVVIAVQSFAIQLPINIIFKCSQSSFACVTSQRTGSDRLIECLDCFVGFLPCECKRKGHWFQMMLLIGLLVASNWEKSEISARDLQKHFGEFKNRNSILLAIYCSHRTEISTKEFHTDVYQT